MERVETQEKRMRLTMRVIGIEGVAPRPDAAPGACQPFSQGRRPVTGRRGARCARRCMPPAEPALPGGFDFGRHFWFLGIGARAAMRWARSSPFRPRRRCPATCGSGGVAKFRQAIGARIGAVLHGDHGRHRQGADHRGAEQISERRPRAPRRRPRSYHFDLRLPHGADGRLDVLARRARCSRCSRRSRCATR